MRRRPLPDPDRIRRRDTLAVGQALTLIADADPDMLRMAAQMTEGRRSGSRVGFTGPPGVGKSSLLRELIRQLRAREETVALLAADPVSPRSGGAFLGDRLRFADLTEDEGVFIRSWGHRAPAGDPTPGVVEAASVLEAAGCEWIFFETVGTGQTETEVLRHMDQKVLVLSPDFGDQYQMLKAGSLEAADLYVVNKSDRPGSESWAEELRGSLARDDFVPTVVLTNALTGKGIAELTAVLSAHPSL